MAVLQRVSKPTTRKGKKVLISKEPKIIEGPKRVLFLQGRKTNDRLRALQNDLYKMKTPDATKLSRHNDITAFEDATPLEKFCRKHETPLFMLISNSKKRPDNVVLGRLFDYTLLDMIELGVDNLDTMKDFRGMKISVGIKPILVFNGPNWDQSQELKQLKSLFIDFFHRENVENVRLQGLEHVISFTVTAEGKILLRSYKVLLKKSGCKTPRIELDEIGPRVDFTLRRSKLPTEDLMKLACKQPKELKVTKKKNISTDGLGTKQGRVHLGKQDVKRLQTRKMKGLKKTPEQMKAALKRKSLVASGIISKNVKKTVS